MLTLKMCMQSKQQFTVMLEFPTQYLNGVGSCDVPSSKINFLFQTFFSKRMTGHLMIRRQELNFTVKMQ